MRHLPTSPTLTSTPLYFSLALPNLVTTSCYDGAEYVLYALPVLKYVSTRSLYSVLVATMNVGERVL